MTTVVSIPRRASTPTRVSRAQLARSAVPSGSRRVGIAVENPNRRVATTEPAFAPAIRISPCVCFSRPVQDARLEQGVALSPPGLHPVYTHRLHQRLRPCHVPDLHQPAHYRRARVRVWRHAAVGHSRSTQSVVDSADARQTAPARCTRALPRRAACPPCRSVTPVPRKTNRRIERTRRLEPVRA